MSLSVTNLMGGSGKLDIENGIETSILASEHIDKNKFVELQYSVNNIVTHEDSLFSDVVYSSDSRGLRGIVSLGGNKFAICRAKTSVLKAYEINADNSASMIANTTLPSLYSNCNSFSMRSLYDGYFVIGMCGKLYLYHFEDGSFVLDDSFDTSVTASKPGTMEVLSDKKTVVFVVNRGSTFYHPMYVYKFDGSHLTQTACVNSAYDNSGYQHVRFSELPKTNGGTQLYLETSSRTYKVSISDDGSTVTLTQKYTSGLGSTGFYYSQICDKNLFMDKYSTLTSSPRKSIWDDDTDTPKLVTFSEIEYTSYVEKVYKYLNYYVLPSQYSYNSNQRSYTIYIIDVNFGTIYKMASSIFGTYSECVGFGILLDNGKLVFATNYFYYVCDINALVVEARTHIDGISKENGDSGVSIKCIIKE